MPLCLPRLLPLGLLASVREVVGQYSFPAYDAAQVTAGPSFAAEAVLQQSLSGFVLTSGRDATLRDINGGKMCVDANGFVPPGYELNGALDLQTCAAIAREQPNVVGFRWGRKSFNMKAYRTYSSPSLPRDTPVKLQDLFPTDGNFTCVIFLVDQNGDPSDFKDTALARQFGFKPFEGRRLHSKGLVKVHTADGDEYKKPNALEGDRGLSVCQQRWTLLQFFHIRAHEFWFCYLPETRWDNCQKELRNFIYVQGMAFIGGIVAFFSVLSFIMRKQGGLIWALLWASRFLVNMMLGMFSVGLLMYWGFQGNEVQFGTVAVLLTVGAFNVLFLPFCCLEYCSWPGVFYLMVLTMSPTILAEVVSYYSALPLLLNHRPMMLGSIAFAIEAVKTGLLGDVGILKEGMPAASKILHTPGYIRMYPGHS